MNSTQRKRGAVGAFIVALAMVPSTIALAPASGTASSASAPATACQAPWGSLVKQGASYSSKQVTDVRAGRHRCFDRLVVDVNDRGRGRPGYQVRYVKTVTKDGSGAPVQLRGGAKLRVIVRAPAHDDSGRPTYRPENRRELVDVTGYMTFRQVAWAGSFEGHTTLGVGVRARLPMRVFVLSDPGTGYRIVVDVAHRWW